MQANIVSWTLISVIYCTDILNVQFLLSGMQDGSVEMLSAVFARTFVHNDEHL